MRKIADTIVTSSFLLFFSVLRSFAVERELPSRGPSITCTGAEEFSTVWIHGEISKGKAEQSQSLGTDSQRQGPCSGSPQAGRIFCVEEIMTIDPVCGMKVDEADTEFKSQFAGKKYFFCSDECQKEFEDRPEEFVQTAA